MNGVSGHAGLFSTAEETFKIAQQFLANQTTLLKPETCKLFRTNFTKGFNEARSIAFQLAETPDSTASNALAKRQFRASWFYGNFALDRAGNRTYFYSFDESDTRPRIAVCKYQFGSSKISRTCSRRLNKMGSI